MKDIRIVIYDGAMKIAKTIKSDGCTFAPSFNFENCCLKHDMRYSEQLTDRKTADIALRECIKNNGHPLKAWIYYAAVRAFGSFAWCAHKKRPDHSGR